VNRRAFLGAVAGGGLALSGRALAQPAAPLVGFVRSSSFTGAEDLVAAFREGLRETGFVEGQNVAVDLRSADDHVDRLPGIVADLLRRPATVLVGNEVSARVALRATKTVPIVFATGGDPVQAGLVASFGRPGGNVTGVSFLGTHLGTKKLELLREVVPRARTIGVLENPDARGSRAEAADVVKAARAVGQPLVMARARTERDFEPALEILARERAGAMLVTGDALFLSHADRLAALTARHALPAIHSERPFVVAGGLMCYGASITDAYRQVGVYTGRILKGERPADLPVMQPTRLVLVVNAKAARVLGLTIPPSVLARVDELIES